MKLLTKTTLYFLLAMIPLLLVAGYYMFSRFSSRINDRSDQELLSDEAEWIQYIQAQEEDGNSVFIKAPDLSIYPTDAEPARYPALTDTYSSGSKSGAGIPYRQLTQVVGISGVSYQVVIRQSQEQKTALVADVTRIMLFVFIGLFIATLLFNRLISQRLWVPFRRSLSKIRSAELQTMEAVQFEETNTREFNELNASLNVMAGRIYRDYVNMKEFTENAAHEMQTPIAVVQSKLELLLQDTNLSDGQMQNIVQSTTALNRLSRLSQDLLLLAKIENNQYEAKEPLNLSETVKKYLLLFATFIDDKQLTVEVSSEDDFMVRLHPFLADTLVGNMLGNAVKYNYTGGMISIHLSQHYISIANTSHQPPIDPGKLFTRMNRSSEADETSNGLGLAIVKRIVDSTQLQIQYTTGNGFHTFMISCK